MKQVANQLDGELSAGQACRASLRRPLVVAALCWAAGIALGLRRPAGGAWIGLACALAAATVLAVVLRRNRAVGNWGLLALVAVGASWAAVRARYTAADDVRQYFDEESRLAQVVGVIEGPIYMNSPERGTFGRFSYKSPSTLLVLNVEAIRLEAGDRAASGKLLVKIEEADHRLQPGDRIRATGWLRNIEGPVNPGEQDYRQTLAQRGIMGRLVLRHRGNWEPLPRPMRAWAPALGAWLSDRAARSLRLGMTHEPARQALLETLLLGRWSPDLAEIDRAFRRVGLAHVLSISGAHLTILLGLVWMLAALVTGRPILPAAAVLVVLTLYLLIVPPQVPLTRAGMMAAAVCIGYTFGRRVGGVDMLALAGLLVLVWRPGDLVDAGFQLSFLGVAALMLFTAPVSRVIYPRPISLDAALGPGALLLRWGADLLAASVVTAALTLPLVAYHFHMVSPLAALLSILTLPLVTGVLALGFFKMIVGLGLPGFGALMARPLAFCADALIRLVAHASRWPGAWVDLAKPPSAVWAAATLAMIAACCAGYFARRRLALAAAVGLSVLWLLLPALAPGLPGVAPTRPAAAPLSVNMFAVGNGSCYLVRLDPGAADRAGYTLMFDCGSGEYLDMGSRSIAPALRSLGVGRIDAMMISHADMDHYCGAVEVMDAVPVGGIMVTPQFMADANRKPASATAMLIEETRRRGVRIEEVSRGWALRAGGGDLELLWPPRDFVAPRHNDTSLVLSVRAAGRRLLLNGDIQQLAITGLLADPRPLRADISELPHHGGFVDASPRWLQAVSPRVVLQSTGMARLIHDKWAGRITPPTLRLITQRRGMVEVDVDAQGRMAWHAFRGGAGAVEQETSGIP